MSVKDRLKFFIKSERMTVSDFEKSIEAGNGYVTNISRSIGVDKLAVIHNKYPRLNLEWLLVDDGLMYRSESNPAVVVSSPENIEEYHTRQLRIPMIDVSAAAGITGYINGSNAEIIDYISLPSHMVRSGSNYLAVRARGESMSPTIYDSSFVIVRELDRAEWSDIPDEHVFVIVSREEAYIKRVKNRFNKGFIVCMSDNTDKYSYPNFNLQADEITCIFHAEFLISARMPNINETYYSRLRQLEDRFDEIEQIVRKIQ